MLTSLTCFLGYFFLWAAMQGTKVVYLPWTTIGGFLAFFNLNTAGLVALWFLYKDTMDWQDQHAAAASAASASAASG